MGDNTIRCEVCGGESPAVLDYLGEHLLEVHGMTVDAYLDKHPKAPVTSQRLDGLWDTVRPKQRRGHPPELSDLRTTWAKHEFPINTSVPAEACLSRPRHYRIPKYGALGNDILHLAMLLADPDCPAVFIHGDSGCGKDAAVHSWSADTHTPGIERQVLPGTDIQAWFYNRAFDQSGTFWEEGPILKALRDGFTCPDGTVVPYIFLVTDIDRADDKQLEFLRLCLDSIERRVVGPQGQVWSILKGTRIIATANSSGGGDHRGLYVSVQPMDATILNRFEAGLQFHQLDWNDEKPVLQARFPVLIERQPRFLTLMGRMAQTLREAIANEELYADFSHRDLCSIFAHATRILSRTPDGKTPKDFLPRATRVWLDKLPDKHVRNTAEGIMDAIYKMKGEGDTSHIKTKTETLASGWT